MIPSSDRWGPFSPNLDAPERAARCRCLRAVVHLTTGPRGETATRFLHAAERDPDALPDAARALNAMAPIDKRQVWASYARLAASERPARSMGVSKLAVSNIVWGMR